MAAPEATNAIAEALAKAHEEASSGTASAKEATRDEKATAKRVDEAMKRPGPSVRAEDLDVKENPFAGHVPLEKPSKYRCASHG